MLIAEDDLVELIKAKKNCAHFKLIVKEKGDDNESEGSDSGSVIEESSTKHSMTTAKLKQFISSDVGTKVLLKLDPLEPAVRRGIIECSVKYLLRECRQSNIKIKTPKRALARMICEIFSALKPEEDMVLKWVNDKVKDKYRNAMLQTSKIGLAKRSTCDVDDDVDVVEIDLVQTQLEYLETRLDAQDIPKIEKALLDTLDTRMIKYASDNVNIFDTYKFFSKSLDLVD